MDWLQPFLEVRAEGLHAPAFDAYLDPTVPVPRAILTHAHADHAVPGHGEVWATAETLALYRRRNPEWTGPGRPFFYGEETSASGIAMRFHPAGHILGSAQIRFEDAGGSLLFTGDFKRRACRTAALADAPHSTTLVTETTFGLPVFRFPPRPQIEERLLAACRRAFDEGSTPILLAYALGKAQEAAAILAEAGIGSVLHGAAWKLLPEYSAAGFSFPGSRAYESGPPGPGEALIVPPTCARTPIVDKVRRRRILYLSGWAIREASRADFDADILLPLSDHADFDELLRHVGEVAPRRVLAMHGYAGDFARILSDRGVVADVLPDLAERAAADS